MRAIVVVNSAYKVVTSLAKHYFLVLDSKVHAFRAQGLIIQKHRRRTVWAHNLLAAHVFAPLAPIVVAILAVFLVANLAFPAFFTFTLSFHWCVN